MLKYTIMFAAVAGLVLALAPPAQAALSYTENFYDPNIGHDQPLSASNTGWEGCPGGWGDPYVAPHVHPVAGGYPNTPDGDGYHEFDHDGQSQSKSAVTKVGEYPIAAVERTGKTTFIMDYGAQYTDGVKFMAQVGGTWYGSETFGTNDATNGGADNGGVTEWVIDFSYDVDTGTWYEATGLPCGYDWRDYTRFIGGPLAGLPVGEITQFGAAFRNTHNNALGGIDNFRVTPEPATLALLAFGGLGILLRRRRR